MKQTQQSKTKKETSFLWFNPPTSHPIPKLKNLIPSQYSRSFFLGRDFTPLHYVKFELRKNSLSSSKFRNKLEITSCARFQKISGSSGTSPRHQSKGNKEHTTLEARKKPKFAHYRDVQSKQYRKDLTILNHPTKKNFLCFLHKISSCAVSF